MVWRHVQTATGTSGNVWKQRFGWVPGKSVSRVHGRPEKPRTEGGPAGNGGKVAEPWKRRGHEWKPVGNKDRMGNPERRKAVSTNAQKTEERCGGGGKRVKRG